MEAARARVDAATFLGVLRAVCAAGVTNVTVVPSVAALPFKQQEIPAAVAGGLALAADARLS